MTTKPSKSEKQPPADERNIVPLDSSYEGASLEDQLFLFWHNYKKIILGVCVALVLVLVGWGVITLVQERREARIRSEYAAATTMDEVKVFADRNAPHSLAGVAYLRAGDYHFENGEFVEAARFYQQASSHLQNPFLGRALIGRGISLAQSGEQNEALTHFESVARNPDHFDIVRTEAHYHAASLAIDMGQTAAARRHIESVLEMDRSRIFASRAMGLQQALPPADEQAAAQPQ
jgi:tetratricopeptide (TPR) repeat protein